MASGQGLRTDSLFSIADEGRHSEPGGTRRLAALPQKNRRGDRGMRPGGSTRCCSAFLRPPALRIRRRRVRQRLNHRKV